MDMNEMVAGAAQGQQVGPPGQEDDQGADAKILALLTQMRDMLDQVIQLMGSDIEQDKQAGFASVDQQG